LLNLVKLCADEWWL